MFLSRLNVTCLAASVTMGSGLYCMHLSFDGVDLFRSLTRGACSLELREIFFVVVVVITFIE